MDWSAGILGSGLAEQMEGRATEVVLRLGRDTFTRMAFSYVECFNFPAALRVSRILDRTLTGERAIADTRALYERIAPPSLIVEGLGAISLAILGAAFEIQGLGGQAPLVNWFTRHAVEGEAIVTFATLKRRAAKAAATAAAPPAHHYPRRAQAPRPQVARFTKRRQGAA